MIIDSNKGAVHIVVLTIVGVTALILLMLIYKTIGELDCVKNPFSCIQKKSVAELAAECVMARCTYGCNSDEVKNIKNNDFSCENQCDPGISQFIAPDRYCGFQFPIKLDGPTETMEIDKETIEQEYTCFLKYDSDLKTIVRELLEQYDLIGLSIHTKILVVKSDLVMDYETPKEVACPPGIGEEIETFQLKTSRPLYVYGSIQTFLAEDTGEIKLVEPLPVTFITDELLYSDVTLGVEKEIILRENEYYPLEIGDGIIIQHNMIIEDITKCPVGEYLITLDIKCGGKEEQIVFCSNDINEEKTFCEGQYKIISKSLPTPSISQTQLATFPFVFGVTKLS